MKQLTDETVLHIKEEFGQTVDQFCLNKAGELVDEFATSIENSGIPQGYYMDNLILQEDIYSKAATIIKTMLSLDKSETKH